MSKRGIACTTFAWDEYDAGRATRGQVLDSILDCLMEPDEGMVEAGMHEVLGSDCVDTETAIDAAAGRIRAVLQAVKDGKA